MGLGVFTYWKEGYWLSLGVCNMYVPNPLKTKICIKYVCNMYAISVRAKKGNKIRVKFED